MDFVYFDLSDQCDPAPDGDGRAKLIRRVEQYVHGHKDTHMANQACIAHRGNKKDLGGGGVYKGERSAIQDSDVVEILPKGKEQVTVAPPLLGDH